jgi:streptomycin 6-kinase
VDQVTETPSSLLGFGKRDGSRVVLKISKSHGDESNSGIVLRAFAGDGSVQLYESDTAAVLLEQLDPGEQLVTLVRRGEDDEATKILADVIGKLAHHSAPEECPTAADWGRGFDRYLASGDQQVPLQLVHEAREVYARLESSQRRTMLLHGDLQHYNVLFDAGRGWVAIDPKGVAGELEYEVGSMLRNPVEQPELFARADVIERRLKLLTTSLHMDYDRALEWSFAQAALSALWDVEDGYPVEPNNPGLILANALKPMLNKGRN